MQARENEARLAQEAAGQMAQMEQLRQGMEAERNAAMAGQQREFAERMAMAADSSSEANALAMAQARDSSPPPPLHHATATATPRGDCDRDGRWEYGSGSLCHTPPPRPQSGGVWSAYCECRNRCPDGRFLVLPKSAVFCGHVDPRLVLWQLPLFYNTAP